MDAGEERFSRTELLLGRETTARLRRQRALVVGVGGVGGHAAEAIARCGVGRLTLVDGDTVDITNCNRQIIATTGTLGMNKVEALAARCREIDPAGEFVAVHRFLREAAEIAALLDNRFDFVIDAIDDVPVKTELIRQLVERGMPFISAMGAGGKLDPAAVRKADISKTYGCPLARVMRKNLKLLGINRGVPVIFSPEPPRRSFTGRQIGSISYMPAVFGNFCAAEAIRTLCGFSEKFPADNLKNAATESML